MRQTDVRRASSLNAPYHRGGGITTKRQNTYQRKLIIHNKMALINNTHKTAIL